jgi:hypothetical protein
LSKVLLAAAAVLVLLAGCSSSTKSAAVHPTRAALVLYEHQYLNDLGPVGTVAADFMQHFGHARSVTASEAGPVASAYSSFRHQLMSQHWPTFGLVASNVHVVAADSDQVARSLRAGAAEADYRKALQELDATNQQAQQLRNTLENLVLYYK